jgi:hypothetical protein
MPAGASDRPRIARLASESLRRTNARESGERLSGAKRLGSPDHVPPLLCSRSAVTIARSGAALKTGSFFRRVVIEVRFAIYRKQHRAAGRPVVVQRTRLAPDIISGRRHPVVILDAALQD